MMPNAAPVAYLRKSVRGRDDLDKSRDLQMAAVNALAARDGVTLARVYDGDWGRSGGRSGRDKRSSMKEMIEAIRAGDVSAVYAYMLDRLMRDTEYALTLWNACADQGVPIIVDGMRYDTADGQHEFFYTMTASQAKAELDKMTKRNRETKSRRLARLATGELSEDEARRQSGGQPLYGDKPGEDLTAVGNAYHAAGSFQVAAGLLTLAKVPSRHGGIWTVTSIATIVRREFPDIAPGYLARAGRSPSRTRLFSGLLTCRCGTTLTAFCRPGRKHVDGSIGPVSVAYYCRAGHLDPRHGTPLMVSEPKVRAWAMAAYPGDALKMTAKPAERVRDSLEDIADRRAKVHAAVDVLPGDVYRAKLAALDKLQAKVAEVQRTGWTLSRAMSWNRPPALVNRDLRNVWPEGIRLGPDMMPLPGQEPAADERE